MTNEVLEKISTDELSDIVKVNYSVGYHEEDLKRTLPVFFEDFSKTVCRVDLNDGSGFNKAIFNSKQTADQFVNLLCKNKIICYKSYF